MKFGKKKNVPGEKSKKEKIHGSEVQIGPNEVGLSLTKLTSVANNVNDHSHIKTNKELKKALSRVLQAFTQFRWISRFHRFKKPFRDFLT